MTERLYYRDSHCRRFDARVLDCVPEGDLWAVVLDRTAFFPEGGGQGGDTGLLNETAVLDTREREGKLLHLCAAPLTPGEQVHGTLNWDLRFPRMQIHSAEHLISGHAHRRWGCENVGFHMDEHAATLDFDRELSEEQLRELEALANASVWENIPYRTLWPSADELAKLPFRQKKELSGPVRLIEVPGVDLCACCAPHVEHSGEIGLIRLTEWSRHRGGVRLTMLAGRGAYADAAARGRDAAALSRLFSVPRDTVTEAAERVLAELENARYARGELERRCAVLLAESARETAGDLLFFLPGEMSAAAARELAEAGKARCGGVCAVFVGSDEKGWRYVLASQGAPLAERAAALNAALRGRGGGSDTMVQGGVAAGQAEIRAHFAAPAETE